MLVGHMWPVRRDSVRRSLLFPARQHMLAGRYKRTVAHTFPQDIPTTLHERPRMIPTTGIEHESQLADNLVRPLRRICLALVCLRVAIF